MSQRDVDSLMSLQSCKRERLSDRDNCLLPVIPCFDTSLSVQVGRSEKCVLR